MERSIYLNALDKALIWSIKHTDFAGRIVFDNEIDTKDSGWLVLGGVIRGVEENWHIGEYDLKEFCRRWTLASVRVDDVKSAWTTFALLLCFEYTKGGFRKLFSADEQTELTAFFRQLDMRYLLEASRNYRVAAAVIDILRLRYRFVDTRSVDPEECINYMLAGYLGDGFFNDDDGRGDNRDLRIDAYSAEIIGLLLHYDEICSWNSFCHEKIMNILCDFCRSNLKLIDSNGEFAKWGRSLRGEAEAKKIFLWEFAQRENMSVNGNSAANRMFDFFCRTGLAADGKIGRDKAFDSGIWDEYTTHVQAQGYGIYGLAMALRFASGEGEINALPSETTSYIEHLNDAGIICGNSLSLVHYVFPYRNRLTKNMFFWHNRITGENDVEVDVSAKFMPIPYFGFDFPAPYAGPTVPFLPMLELADGRVLIPRNLDTDLGVKDNTVRRKFDFCNRAEYVSACDLSFYAEMDCAADKISFKFDFVGTFPENSKMFIHIFEREAGKSFAVSFTKAPAETDNVILTPSIYSSTTSAKRYRLEHTDSIEYSIGF